MSVARSPRGWRRRATGSTASRSTTTTSTSPRLPARTPRNDAMTHLFNASEYLLDRRIAAGDGARLALTGPAGDLSYAELHDRVCRTAAGLRAAGVQPEQRVLMVMSDSPEFVVVYLAAMRVGAVPVPVSTMLRADGIAELLRDSRARFLAVSSEFAEIRR